MKKLGLLLLIAIYFPLTKVSASTLTQLAAGATIGISVLEAPETWKKFKRAVRKVQHPKKKEQQSTPVVDCGDHVLIQHPDGTAIRGIK